MTLAQISKITFQGNNRPCRSVALLSLLACVDAQGCVAMCSAHLRWCMVVGEKEKQGLEVRNAQLGRG